MAETATKKKREEGKESIASNYLCVQCNGIQFLHACQKCKQSKGICYFFHKKEAKFPFAIALCVFNWTWIHLVSEEEKRVAFISVGGVAWRRCAQMCESIINGIAWYQKWCIECVIQILWNCIHCFCSILLLLLIRLTFVRDNISKIAIELPKQPYKSNNAPTNEQTNQIKSLSHNLMSICKCMKLIT